LDLRILRGRRRITFERRIRSRGGHAGGGKGKGGGERLSGGCGGELRGGYVGGRSEPRPYECNGNFKFEIGETAEARAKAKTQSWGGPVVNPGPYEGLICGGFLG
jgi:hypothetical protein